MAHFPQAAIAGTGLAKAEWLCLAASPTFAMMALLTHVYGPAPNLCSLTGNFPLDGMVLMYLLMSVFHLEPWLRLALGR